MSILGQGSQSLEHKQDRQTDRQTERQTDRQTDATEHITTPDWRVTDNKTYTRTCPHVIRDRPTSVNETTALNTRQRNSKQRQQAQLQQR